MPSWWAAPGRCRAGTATTIPSGASTTPAVQPPPTTFSPLWTVGQVQQHRAYPPMTVGFLDQAELREDRVDVPLHRPNGDEQALGDGRVVRAGRHLGQHLALASGEVAQTAAGPGAGD